MTPQPAVPSEGAMFVLLKHIPEGWEWRYRQDIPWEPFDHHYGHFRDQLVEARPKPEPLVSVMLPKGIVEHWATNRASWWGEVDAIVVQACRAALEADER